jgi:hypothetical protein
VSISVEEVKNAYRRYRCFNKRNGKIDYLAADKIKKESVYLYCFYVKTSKLERAGKKVVIEEMRSTTDVTLMEVKKWICYFLFSLIKIEVV